MSPPRLEAASRFPVKSDSDGEFEIYWARRDRAYAVIGFTRDRERGFAVVADPGTALVECKLQPTCNWRARLRCPDLGLSKVGATVAVRDVADRLTLIMLESCGGDAHLVLPPGDFLLCASSDSLALLRKPLHIAPTPRDVVTIVDVPAPAWAMQIGRPFPEWQVTEARNARSGLRVADYAGRWLAVAFLRDGDRDSWGGTMSKLATLHADPVVTARLAIVAIVLRGPADLDAVYASHAELRESRGWPELPPIPLLLDGKGRTAELLGVDRDAVVLLVEPGGRLWGCVNPWGAARVSILRAAARGELPKRETQVVRTLTDRPRMEVQDAEWNGLPVDAGMCGLDEPSPSAGKLLRSRQCNPCDVYLAAERRAELQKLLAASAPELVALKGTWDRSLHDALRDAVRAGRLVPAHEGMLTAAERATLDSRAGAREPDRAYWMAQLLRQRTPPLRRVDLNERTYFWSLDDVPAARPAHAAYVEAQLRESNRIVAWFEQAGTLPRADAAALRLRVQERVRSH